MKTLVERGIQYMILALAAYLGLTIVAPLVKHQHPAADDRLIVPLTAAAIYVFLTVTIGFVTQVSWLRKLFDKRAKFVGTYLSCHEQGDTIGLLAISYSFLDRKYLLRGTSFSLSTKDAVGGWNATSLDLDINARSASYVYAGTGEFEATSGKVRGHGYGRIEFFDDNITLGTGEFVDDGPTRIWTRSAYTRLTPSNIKFVLNRNSLRSQSWPDFVAGFAVLPAQARERFARRSSARQLHIS